MKRFIDVMFWFAWVTNVVVVVVDACLNHLTWGTVFVISAWSFMGGVFLCNHVKPDDIVEFVERKMHK